MQPISYARHRFPPDVIRHAVWLYLRFTLSYRDVEDLLVERGLEVSNETIRRWVLKFGLAFARSLRRGRPTPHDSWHLDEMVVSIAGRRMYMWRAVDSMGEVLEVSRAAPILERQSLDSTTPLTSERVKKFTLSVRESCETATPVFGRNTWPYSSRGLSSTTGS
jgi:hypothetical protein